jgi:hypothetical protein
MNESLRYVAEAYFHQDYDAEYASPDDAVRDVRASETPARVAQLVAEISRMLDAAPTETDLAQVWEGELGAMYEPEQDGITYSAWFERMRDILTGRIE